MKSPLSCQSQSNISHSWYQHFWLFPLGFGTISANRSTFCGWQAYLSFLFFVSVPSTDSLWDPGLDHIRILEEKQQAVSRKSWPWVAPALPARQLPGTYNRSSHKMISKNEFVAAEGRREVPLEINKKVVNNYWSLRKGRSKCPWVYPEHNLGRVWAILGLTDLVNLNHWLFGHVSSWSYALWIVQLEKCQRSRPFVLLVQSRAVW